MSKDSFSSEESALSSGESFGQAVKEAGDKAITNNTLVERADHASYIRRLALEGDRLTNWNAQRLWLKHCLSPRTEFLFLQMGAEEYREEDVRKILDSCFLCSSNLTTATRTHFKRGISDWFLRRYNWVDAYAADRCIPYARAWTWYSRVTAVIVVLLLSLTAGLAYVTSRQVVHGHPVAEAVFFAAVIVVTIFLVLKWQRFIFVRLLATIMVGFVPIVVESALWELAVSMDLLIVALVAALVLSFGVLYCSDECARIASLGKRRALKRALPVTLWGMLFAFVTATVLSYVMGAAMLHDLMTDPARAETVIMYTGRYGNVYPAAVFLFSPVSLFVGLFINSFWQERTVTDPF